MTTSSSSGAPPPTPPKKASVVPLRSTTSSSGEKDRDAEWLAAFHAGDRSLLADCYREHAPRVLAAARRIVGGVDAETITHEVFYRLLSNPKMRESFRGGNLGAWLTQVATRSAVDDLRKRRREVEPLDSLSLSSSSSSSSSSHADVHVPVEDTRDKLDDEMEAKRLVERFREERLPPEWEAVFDARFLRQLPQREAAKELGMPRTTLVYQEQKIRALLQRFLLGDSKESKGRESTS